VNFDTFFCFCIVLWQPFALSDRERSAGGKMNSLNVIFGLINISSALLFIAISVPLVKQKISMNSFYGFRIKRAFESNENWFKINTYGGKQLISWSIPLIIIGIFCFLFPFESDRKDIMAIFLVALPITIFTSIAIIKTILFAKKM
jgi:hypothetical protein